ncbi:MAG TPA: cytochrome P460 family protein [Candidatus Acidoferrum sp.]|nr:cytochrome P460 family protein [Candidatus Acidoferrum sp.]
MIRTAAWLALSLVLLLLSARPPHRSQATQAEASTSTTPEYTADGRLKFPANYREWIYLSAGIDMSYGPASNMGHSMFDNVFVNPESYKAFLATGTWPDKTMLVLEVRSAANKNAINKAGQYQTPERMGLEVHVKDEARFTATGRWAFFGFDTDAPSKMDPKEMDCYSCHQQHAAVDTTFVQFYPTLIEIAKKKGTLSPAYVKEEAAATEQTQR